MTPEVTIITPLYNSARFIEATLDSVMRQSFENWESILIDDGSTDETAERIKPYLRDERFRYIKQANQGIAGARNTGIRMARGEWVCLLDHDDRWLPEKLEKQLRAARENNYDIIATDAYLVKGSAPPRLYSDLFPAECIDQVRRIHVDPNIDVFALLIQKDFLCASSVMIRKRLFDDLGLLDPASAPADDYEMWLRCMPQARIGYITEPLIEYVMHEDNFSNDELKMIEYTIRVLTKASRRFRSDPLRRKQFDYSLTVQHHYLLERASELGRYGFMTRHMFGQIAQGQRGWRAIYWWMASRQPLSTLLRKLRTAEEPS